MAGTIAGVGERVSRWKIGDRVCALTNGGGYAEYVAVPAGQVLPIPEGWSAIEAATLPKMPSPSTTTSSLARACEARELVLVHGGTSGIGTTAIMFATALGATAIATAGSPEKCAACIELGARHAIDYRLPISSLRSSDITQRRGVDVVLDIVGGDYLPRNLECLALDGRIVCIATLGGSRVELDLRRLFAKRGAIMASHLRGRTAAEKAAIARALERRIWPLLLERDAIVPVIDAVYSFERAAEAHARMESSAHIGKLVLTPRSIPLNGRLPGRSTSVPSP